MSNHQIEIPLIARWWRCCCWCCYCSWHLLQKKFSSFSFSSSSYDVDDDKTTRVWNLLVMFRYVFIVTVMIITAQVPVAMASQPSTTTTTTTISLKTRGNIPAFKRFYESKSNNQRFHRFNSCGDHHRHHHRHHHRKQQHNNRSIKDFSTSIFTTVVPSTTLTTKTISTKTSSTPSILINKWKRIIHCHNDILSSMYNYKYQPNFVSFVENSHSFHNNLRRNREQQQYTRTVSRSIIPRVFFPKRPKLSSTVVQVVRIENNQNSNNNNNEDSEQYYKDDDDDGHDERTSRQDIGGFQLKLNKKQLDDIKKNVIHDYDDDKNDTMHTQDQKIQTQVQQDQQQQQGQQMTLLSSVLEEAAAQATQQNCRLLGTKCLGIDYGLTRTGIAVSVGYEPIPITIISETNVTKVCNEIVHIATIEQVSIIVIGLPFHKNGTIANQTMITIEFGKQLIQKVFQQFGPNSIQIVFFDERYTSKEAAARIHSKYPNQHLYGILDGIAACIILENYYLDNGEGAYNGSILLSKEQHLECYTVYQRNQQRRIEQQQRILAEREERINRRKESMIRAKLMDGIENKTQIVPNIAVETQSSLVTSSEVSSESKKKKKKKRKK